MEPIGGYLGLEQSPLRRWHGDAIALDLGRHALEVVLLARGYRKLLAPRYTCDVLAPAIRRAQVELTLYDLDGQLDPVLPEGRPAPGEALLYTNYFGLKQATAERLAATVPNLILDYAHDFYGKLPAGVDGFVTCRKFIGVPDGAYLYCEAAQGMHFAPADATGRWEYLLKAAAQGREAAFPDYQLHERNLADAPVCGMGPLTAVALAAADHERIVAARRQNRDLLHAALGAMNRLPIDPAAAEVPMAYPFLPARGGAKLREQLRAARIYTPCLWPATLGILGPSDGGHRFVHEVVYLPVDQRYGLREMRHIQEQVIRHVAPAGQM